MEVGQSVYQKETVRHVHDVCKLFLGQSTHLHSVSIIVDSFNPDIIQRLERCMDCLLNGGQGIFIFNEWLLPRAANHSADIFSAEKFIV